jgi:hypothetical protein
MFLALICALIYTVIPDSSIWVYVLLKLEWWSIFGIALYVEFLILCIPIVPDWIYLTLYAVGIFVPLALRSAAVITNNWSNTIFQLIISIIGLPFLIVALIYLSCCKQHEVIGLDTLTTADTSVTDVYFDMYNACSYLDEDEIQCDDRIDIYSTNSDESNSIRNSIESALHSTNNNVELTQLPTIRIEEAPRFHSSSLTDINHNMTNYKNNNNQVSFSDGKKLYIVLHPLTMKRTSKTAIKLRTILAMNNNNNNSDNNNNNNNNNNSRNYSNNATDHIARYLASSSTSTSSLSTTSTSSNQSSTACYSYLSNLQYLFPKFYYRKIQLPLGISIGNLQFQCILVGIFCAISNGYFFFLVYFTNFLRNQTKHEVKLFVFFIFFIGISAIAKLLLKRIGLEIDKQKIGSTSIYFVAEFLGLMYYYTFYRLLFESIHSWYIFFSFQALHLCFEWICYPLRASKVCYQCLITIEKSYFHSYHILLPKGINYDDWLSFLSLDFGVRFVVMISAAIGIMILLITVQYLPYIHNGLQQSNREKVVRICVFILFAMILEIINAYSMNYFCFQQQQSDIIKLTIKRFQDKKFIVMAFVISVNLFINPIYTWTSKD